MRVDPFFSAKRSNNNTPCALVEWGETVGNSLDKTVAVLVVKPGYTTNF